MVKTALYLTVSSWALLLMGIIVIGVVAHMFGNPWLLITVGLIIVAAWSIVVYRVAETLVRRGVNKGR
ncbi:hypothetical protein [Caldivirga maquilingensis]|uniref:Uncharacterized protein n=1 Tax=Caldivirga maquilingensis (strain ATCC 700844 / DSM 13496 / JCM 10307 / IC-167) TaxID=397948 RepID=A8MDF4_CALMQ|nr:hypothetical protein [Caldivirga maquilingensis]ABW01810.1 hypothetical protein Cmaq_0978 [Caldivirga maquilingensis IC-167]